MCVKWTSEPVRVLKTEVLDMAPRLKLTTTNADYLLDGTTQVLIARNSRQAYKFGFVTVNAAAAGATAESAAGATVESAAGATAEVRDTVARLNAKNTWVHVCTNNVSPIATAIIIMGQFRTTREEVLAAAKLEATTAQMNHWDVFIQALRRSDENFDYVYMVDKTWPVYGSADKIKKFILGFN